MDDVTHLGLDVHKETIAVAILRPGDRDPDERVIPNTPQALKSLIRTRRSSGPLVACYEAGCGVKKLDRPPDLAVSGWGDLRSDLL